MPIAITSLTDWFNELVLLQQIFYGIGMFALVIVILQLILMTLGIGLDGLEGLDLDVDMDLDTDMDLDVDGADGDGSAGLSVISIQTLTSFFFAFGWVGGMAMEKGAPFALASIIALAAGVVFMFASWFLLKKLLGLQSTGNLNYAGAIGKQARVYVTLPGDGEDGGGQIELKLQSRLITASARKESPGRANPGDPVKIIGNEGTTYLVEMINETTEPN